MPLGLSQPRAYRIEVAMDFKNLMYMDWGKRLNNLYTYVEMNMYPSKRTIV
jgi:hypothetical protein